MQLFEEPCRTVGEGQKGILPDKGQAVAQAQRDKKIEAVDKTASVYSVVRRVLNLKSLYLL